METRSRARGDAAKSTFVDIDATAIWNAEYIRYRVNRCTDLTARDRVFAQIEGRGVQPVCGAPASVSLFPSSGDNLRFRDDLETEYRDALKSAAREYHVDAEYGAWLMREYVWLRIVGLSHPQAITRLTTSGFVPAPWPPEVDIHETTLCSDSARGPWRLLRRRRRNADIGIGKFRPPTPGAGADLRHASRARRRAGAGR